MNSFWQPYPLPFQLHWESPLTKAIWLAFALAAGLGLAILPLPAAGVLALGIAVLIAILIEPLVALALTLVAGPFGALENIILGTSSINSGQLLLLLTLAAWLTRNVAHRRPLFPRLQKWFALPLISFLFIGTVSLLNAPSLIDGIKELVKWLQIGLVAGLVMDSQQFAGRLKHKNLLHAIVAAVLLAGLSQALIGVWQFGLRGHGPEHFLVMGRFYRAYGTFEQPNPFAGFLGLTLPLAIGLALGIGSQVFSGRPKSGANWLPKLKALSLNPYWWLAGGSAVVLAAGLLISWSRGAWLGAAAGFTAMLFFLPRKTWQGTVLVPLLLTVGVVALQTGLLPNSISDRLIGFTDQARFQDVRGVAITPDNFAVMERMAHWQAALNMSNAHPWLGVGLGNYEAAYSQYALINWPNPLGHAHNYYLNLLAEIGVLGLLAYLLFWAAVIWVTGRSIRRSNYPQRGIALGLMGAWVHLAVHHMVDNLYVNNIYLHLGVLLGLLLLLNGQSKNYDRTG